MAVFTVHLWAGVFIGVYAIVIGLTGAALMFRPELQAWAHPELFQIEATGGLADVSTVTAAVEARYPDGEFSTIDYPRGRRGAFLTYVRTGRDLRSVFLHPSSGAVIGELPPDGWVQRLQALHYNLWLADIGIVVNGLAAACLLLMCATGLVIWWPGLAQWRRGFTVDWRWGWRRTAWDLHRAAGIWVVALLATWAASGVYFAFPLEVRQVVGLVADFDNVPLVRSARAENLARPVAVQTLIRRAEAAWPGARVASVYLARGPAQVVGIVLTRGSRGDHDRGNDVTLWFDQFTGAVLQTNDAARRATGDAFLQALGALHFGGFGGLLVRLLWAAGGLLVPVLAMTGFILWWNRVVRAAR